MKKNNRNEILQTIHQALEPWLDDHPRIRQHTDLISDIGIDSVGILQMILYIENKYQIEIPVYEMNLEMLANVNSFIDLIESKINANL